MKIHERFPRNRIIAAAAMSGTLLAGCSTISVENIREESSPVVRADLDHGGRLIWHGDGITEARQYRIVGNDCLKDTPYDPIVTGGGQPALAELEYDDNGGLVLALQPARVYGADAETLRLTGFDNYEQPLAPADEESVAIFSRYGC